MKILWMKAPGCYEHMLKILSIMWRKSDDRRLVGNLEGNYVMFDFFWNWLDPKILKMENWVNIRVVDTDKVDIDLDKLKKGEVRENNMFRKPIPGSEGQVYGPFITNLSGAKLMGYLQGPDTTEMFCLLEKQDKLWWRHRIAGSTEDFMGKAFEDMEEFFLYVNGDTNKFWECALRTQATLVDSNKHPILSIVEIKSYVSTTNAATAG